MKKLFLHTILLIKTFTLIITFGLSNQVQAQDKQAESLTIERLTWAGLKITSGQTTVLVDAVGKDLWDGNAPEGLVPVTADSKRRYALITHPHNDHLDVETLKTVLGEKGYVISPESHATYLVSRGLKVIPAKLYHPVSGGGFIFTAVPASDGFGDEQVSWVISKGDKKIIHGGDTLWHGKWHIIGQQYGPFDVAFLPINGALTGGAEVPATLTAAQAVEAALTIKAEVLVPIHYGLNDPPYYVETGKPLEDLKTTAERRQQTIKHLKPGETIELNE